LPIKKQQEDNKTHNSTRPAQTMHPPQHIYGIDFSGGKDAGGKNLGWESP